MADFINKDRPCSVDGCEKPAHSRGWCGTHYASWRRLGTVTPYRASIGERLDAKTRVNSETDCWEWEGKVGKNGYGSLHFEGRMQYVHRLSYARHIGPIPDGLVLDHLCRNRACLNPAHLEAVTHRENIRRGVKQKWFEEKARRAA